MNSIFVIHPYNYQGVWVFDDASTGLVQEPFVAGADTIIERMVEHIPNAGNGVSILFSAAPFPGYTHELLWRREDCGGNWFYSPRFDLEGWLCPALFKYFEAVPLNLFVQIKSKTP
jgi:hypothetical protein